jgi:hypothetical protein
MGKLLLRQRNLHQYILRSDGKNTDKYCSKQKLIYHSKWLLEIKNTVYECGLNVMLDVQRIAKSDYISKNVKKCLSDKNFKH